MKVIWLIFTIKWIEMKSIFVSSCEKKKYPKTWNFHDNSIENYLPRDQNSEIIKSSL